ncbi:MAG: VOC family protein [Acetobacteraceae bacterium]|nr:VOC family protein [Acetobacteraceae bacterium]
MSITRLDHYSIRTTDLAATERFYADILGLEVGPRPNFPFPGVWLYQGGIAVVHVVGIDPNDSSGLKDYLGDKAADTSGTGTIDHVAFVGNDVEAMRAKFRAAGVHYRDRTVPAMNLEQVFLEDPNGVTIELNFPGAA